VLRKLLTEIGGTALSDDLPGMWKRVDEVLTGASEVEDLFILLLDYDQNGAERALEILRHLAPLESFEKRVLRVVIAVSPDVGEEFQHSEFADEIRRVPLSPLTSAEVESYIDYRLRLVGWRGNRPFTASTSASIAERSSGRPSAINEICLNLLQDPAKTESGRSESATAKKDSISNEYYVDMSSAKPLIAAPAHSLNRRTAALACIVLVLILTVAGLWYRSATKTHGAKHVTAETTVPFAIPLHYAVLRDEQSRLPNPAHALMANGAGRKGIAVSTTTDLASKPARDGKTVRLSPVASPPASALLSATPGKLITYDTVAARLTSPVQTPPASPTTDVLNNTRNDSEETIAKTDHKVVTERLSHVAIPQRVSTSSAVPEQPAASRPTAVRGADVAAGGDRTRRAEELAAYQIRLGDAYMNVGDYDKALRSFSNAIAFASDDKPAEQKVQDMAAYEIRLGDAYMNIGDYDKALRSFSRAMGFAPDNKEAKQKVERAGRAEAGEENILQ
jgi:Tetratricopeptide repeat